MWFYVFLLVLAVLFVFCVSRTNLYRNWRVHGKDPQLPENHRGGQSGTNYEPPGAPPGGGFQS
jgi:hypothetical protein